MDLVSIALTLLAIACVGFLAYLLMQIPMMAPFADVIRFAVIVLLVLYILGVVVGYAPLVHAPVARLR